MRIAIVSTFESPVEGCRHVRGKYPYRLLGGKGNFYLITPTFFRRGKMTRLFHIRVHVYVCQSKIKNVHFWQNVCGRMVRHTIPDEGFEPSTTGLKVQRSTD